MQSESIDELSKIRKTTLDPGWCWLGQRSLINEGKTLWSTRQIDYMGSFKPSVGYQYILTGMEAASGLLLVTKCWKAVGEIQCGGCCLGSQTYLPWHHPKWQSLTFLMQESTRLGKTRGNAMGISHSIPPSIKWDGRKSEQLKKESQTTQQKPLT